MAEVFINGRSHDRAVLLLAAAEKAGMPLEVVRTTTSPAGYRVPEELAEAVASEDAFAESRSSHQPPGGEAPQSPYESSNSPGRFDPSEHGVEQVLAYLGVGKDHDPVTAEEFDRVIAAERAGKQRKTILEAQPSTSDKEQTDE